MTARRRLGSGWRAGLIASAAALAGAGLCACAGFLGIAPDDEVAFTDGATPPDARAEARADSPTGSDDAQDEASDDATPDAPGDQATSEAGTWCQVHPGHFFCADFDEGSLDAGWNETPNLGGGGSLSLDPSNAAPGSAPASLFATGPALDSGSAHAAVATNLMMTPTSELDIALDLRADRIDGAGRATEAVGIPFGTATEPYNLQLNVFFDHASLDEQPQGGGIPNQNRLSSWKPVIGQWSHFDIRVRLAPSPTVTVTVDGSPQLANANLTAFASGSVGLQVGVVYAPSPTSGAAVHVDDVTVDFPDGG